MILLTGASGFVGRIVLRMLVDRGHRVRCLTRRMPTAPDAGAGGVEWAQGDISDPSSLINAAQGVQKIIHLVGIIVPSGENTFEKVHAQGTHHLVEAAKKAGVQKIVHMSALGTHVSAKSIYHQTKWKGEVYVRYAGIPYTIFRPSIIHGPGDQFLNMFARMIRYSPLIPLVGGGVNRLQPIWVQDVAEFFVRALDNPQSDGKLYELGGPHDYSMRELMEILMEIVGKKRPMISVPIPFMRAQAALMELLFSKPPVTRDQLVMLSANNTCDNKPALEDFGIALAELIPTLKKTMAGCHAEQSEASS